MKGVITPAILLGLAGIFLTAPGLPFRKHSRDKALLKEINRLRREHHLSPLRYHRGLATLARAHTRRMIRHGSLSHKGFEQRVRKARILWGCTSYCVENVYKECGYEEYDPERIVQSWKRSRGHYQNLMANVRVAGVSVLEDSRGCRWATYLACGSCGRFRKKHSP